MGVFKCTLSALAVIVIGASLPNGYQSLRVVMGWSNPGIRTLVSYVNTPASLEEMIKVADIVAVGTALRVSPGRVVPIDDSDTVNLSLAFQLVDLVVDEIVKGDALTVITLERLDDAQNGRPVTSHHDGGPFAAGSRHLLFLKKQDDTPYYYLVNDEARFAVTSDGRLENTAAEGAVVDRLRGLSLTVATNVVSRAVTQ